MTKQEFGPESNPNTCWFTKFIQNFCCCCNEIGMKDASLLESLIACWYGESEPQKLNLKSGQKSYDMYEINSSEIIFANISKCIILKSSLGDVGESPNPECETSRYK